MKTKTRGTALILFCLLLALPLDFFSQTSWQGFTLGTKNSEKNIETYYAGIKGVLMAFNLNDGRTFQIGFAPSNDGKSISRLKKSAYDAIVTEMEKDFKVKFERVNSKKNDKDFYMEAYNGNIAYIVDVKYDPNETFPYDIMCSVVDLELEQIAIEQGK